MKISHIAMPPKPEVTRLQLSNVLSVLQFLGSFIIPLKLHGDEDGGTPGTLSDGGSLLAAEQSFIRACNLLDRIVDEPERWNTAHTDQLERVALIALAMQASPHARLRPQVTPMPDGTFIASHGHAAESLIYGVGKTIEEALTDFDRQFIVPAEGVRKVQIEPEPEPVAKPKKRKKKL